MVDLDEVLNFFPPGSTVRAVPNFSKPKLIFEDKGFQSRWSASSLFPATRFSAKILRELKRIQVGFGIKGEAELKESEFLIGPLVQDKFPNSLIQILLGTDGPAQKAIVKIVNSTHGGVEAFIKFGSSKISQERIQQEHDVLTNLPNGLGPVPLGLEKIGTGLALMVSSLDGVQPGPELPPSENVVDYLNALEVPGLQSVDSNDLLMDLKNFSAFDFVHEVLSRKKWKQVFSHGDFAPWNLRIVGKRVQAFDWEYGRLKGLPYIDLAFYVQQVGALIFKWSSEKTKSESIAALRKYYPELAEEEALAFSLLAAMRSYHESEKDGHPSDFFIQPWRKAMWEGH